MDSNEQFKEIFKTKEWEKVQKTLAEAAKSQICTIDINGDEISNSGELPHLPKVIRTTKFGHEAFDKSKTEAIKKVSEEKNKIILHYSEDGLLNIWVPIEIEEEIVGAIGFVSLLDTKELKSDEIVRRTDFNFEEINEAIKKTKKTSPEDIKIYGSMLYTISKTIPGLLKQKRETDKKMLQLNSIYNIIRMINSTLELEKILIHIINFLIRSLRIKNCSIIILEETKLNIGYYYKKEKDIRRVEEVIIKEVTDTKSKVKIEDLNEDFRLNKIENDFDFKSIISFPLEIKKEVIGVINLYLNGIEKISEENMEFISVITDQAAMAIFNAKEFEEAKESAIIDKLTDLYNRRYFMDVLEKDIIKEIERDKPLSIAMFDIDDFKNYNDTNGHVKGDTLIKNIAEILKKEATEKDIVGRYGGEEFIIIFPEADNSTAFNITENIRKKIENNTFGGEEKQPNKKVTISAGLVTCMDKSIRYRELIELVDKALYKSKVSGKNKVTSKIIVNKNLPQIDTGEVKKESDKFKKN